MCVLQPRRHATHGAAGNAHFLNGRRPKSLRPAAAPRVLRCSTANVRPLAGTCAYQFANLVVGWKLPCLVLRVDQITVDLDVENTAAALNQFRFHAKLFRQKGR